MMELYRATIYRQTMFAEFEKKIYDKIEKDEPLTADILSDIYYELNKTYFGTNVSIDDEIRYEWERIPHFYYNFYVYKYAIGLSCATKIVNDILDGKENAVSNYLNFLKSGGSDYPANELLLAGVDVKSPDVIISALNYFDKIIDEFDKVYNEK